MKISKYGITLSLLRQQDIEFVSQKFYPKDEIPSDESAENTPNNVQEWIDSIYTFKNFYYIIEYKGVKIGMINDKVLDWKSRTSEIDLLLWDESYMDSVAPMLTLLCLLETGFHYLNWNEYKTRVSQDDSKRISRVKSLGFVLQKGNNPDQEYLLSREHFETKATKVLEEAREYIDEASGEGYMLLEAADYETGVAQKIEYHITETGIYLYRKGISGGRKYSMVG